MLAQSPGTAAARTASLIVVNPGGNRSRVAIEPVPFCIGRQADNHLVLRDNRASRNHARIVFENGDYFIEDLKSSHGVFVNSERVQKQRLHNSDRIEFGSPDSYALVFSREEDEIQKLLSTFSSARPARGGAESLVKLRALVDVARALQNSLATDDVLGAVVDAALAFTGLERGFLLLDTGDGMEIAVARDRSGTSIPRSELKVPVRAIQRALRERRELLAMSFDPTSAEYDGNSTVEELELRSVVCVPLVRVRGNSSEETQMITSKGDTVGVIYLDSKQAADLSTGNREVLQTLALEASTILENARLLEEERVKQRMEEELNIAREIQSSLLPRALPSSGWFRAAASSLPSHQVGGDYYDVKPAGPDRWSLVVADVSGKGVSSGILAALLQGALALGSEFIEMDQMMSRVNQFLNERTEGEKYATVFYCTIDKCGKLQWVNAGHVTPFVVRGDGKLERLNTTGMPVGLLPAAEYDVKTLQLCPGDKLVAYSDGLSEAQDEEGRFFDSRMREVIQTHARNSFRELHDALVQAVEVFARNSVQTDDITAAVVEFVPNS
jgi:phosphoserine phosphatase RsbU/P